MTWALGQEISTAGGTVRYDRAGSGPDVVLVHGTPWSSFSWHRIIPELTKNFRVHWYDLPGYGASEMRDGQKVSLDLQGEVFAELIEAWGVSWPLVIGHDFGGAITLRGHLLHGVEYERYVLMNAVSIAPWGSPFFAHVREHTSAFAGMPAYIHRAVVETYIRGALGPEGLPDDDLAGLLSPWLSDEGQAAFYRQIAQADQRFTDEVEPKYPAIRCPAMVIWGEDDPWIPIEKGRELQARIPGAAFHPIANAGHLVQLEASRAVAQCLMEFFSKEKPQAEPGGDA